METLEKQKLSQGQRKLVQRILLTLTLVLFATGEILAHCDRENGPVAKAAREALDTGEFERIVIWVGQEQEQELQEKFRQSLAVYQKRGDAEELAKKYFMETAVRLHREAEGMPYTGLKPAAPNPPDIEAAERALETGNLEPVTDLLSEKMQEEVSRWFRQVLDARKNKENTISAGREWVDNYVKYITYIHKLHQTIEAGPPHGVDAH